MTNENWHLISDLAAYDTPLMAVYPGRVKANIKLALQMLGGDAKRLMPHVKTHKTAEVLRMFLDEGIDQVKCATISEAELSAQSGMSRVLLAYQPAGAKIDRLAALINAYPTVQFSCLVDNLPSAAAIGPLILSATGKKATVYLDLNTGMNRTGYAGLKALADFYSQMSQAEGINLIGLHIYDGHLQGITLDERFAPAKLALQQVRAAVDAIVNSGLPRPAIIAGGSNTFAYYAQQEDITCSPGTFVFWDMGYTQKLPELKFQPAAVLVSTIISKPAPDLLCLDLGYKSVSSENPIDKRVLFPWNPDLEVVAHSEEHLTLRTAEAHKYTVGSVLYGVPYHICPTVALYDELAAVEEHQIQNQWPVVARRRKLCL